MGSIKVSNDITWIFPFLSPNGTKPSQYICQVELDHEIPPGILFHDCLVAIAKAHEKVKNGNQYVCYGSWIGKGLVWLLCPLENAEQATSLISDEQALCEALGEEQGKKIYQDYQGTLIYEKYTTLEYQPQYSNPKTTFSTNEGDTPMEYLFYSTITLADNGAATEFDNAYEKIIQAHQQHEQGIDWVTYKDTTSNVLHQFSPMRKFGEMDTWPTITDVLKVYDEKEAAWVKDIYYQNILSQQMQIMTFVPSCDNSGSEYVE